MKRSGAAANEAVEKQGNVNSKKPEIAERTTYA